MDRHDESNSIHVKYLLFFSDFKSDLDSADKFSKNKFSNIKFDENPSSASSCSMMKGGLRWTDMTNPIVAFNVFKDTSEDTSFTSTKEHTGIILEVLTEFQKLFWRTSTDPFTPLFAALHSSK
jgi:hypothetical protein